MYSTITRGITIVVQQKSTFSAVLCLKINEVDTTDSFPVLNRAVACVIVRIIKFLFHLRFWCTLQMADLKIQRISNKYLCILEKKVLQKLSTSRNELDG
jgi:hypothetical protein